LPFVISRRCMIRFVAAVSLLLAACPAAAIERKKTLYLDRLAGFERHVRAAIDEARMRVTVLDESIRPDYRMFLDPKFRSAQAEFLYTKTTGRSENAVLELFCTQERKVLVSYSFRLTGDETEQREAARRFVDLMRKRLKLGGLEGDAENPEAGGQAGVETR
jgi:hypothetical protein